MRTRFSALLILCSVSLCLGCGLGPWGHDAAAFRAKAAKARMFVDSMKTPLEAYFADHGKYPESSLGLDALISPPKDVDPDKGNWPYITKSAIQLDPWGQPYNYVSPGTHNPDKYDLWSNGPDRKSGTKDDIVNWE